MVFKGTVTRSVKRPKDPFILRDHGCVRSKANEARHPRKQRAETGDEPTRARGKGDGVKDEGP